MSLRRLSTAKGTESRWSLRLVVAGTAADGAPELGGPAKTWTSATPYTPSRFAQRGVARVEHLRADVTRELDHRGLPAPTRVEVIDRRWEEWRRYRPSAGRRSPQGRAAKPSAFLRLHFAEPVSGPLALGHLSHFGLGLFTPDV